MLTVKIQMYLLFFFYPATICTYIEIFRLFNKQPEQYSCHLLLCTKKQCCQCFQCHFNLVFCEIKMTLILGGVCAILIIHLIIYIQEKLDQ